MTNINTEIFSLLEQVRQLALSYGDTEEAFPWGNRVFWREMKGCNFLFVNERADHLEVMVRLPGEIRAKALTLPFVELNKAMGYKGWVSARLSNQAELDKVLPYIEISYKLNKPVRRLDELMEGEAPEILDFLDKVRQAAFSYGDIEEFFPYGDRAFRKRKGQIFLYASEQADCLTVSVRLPLGIREYALSLPDVEVPKYIGHKGWVTAKVSNPEELENVLAWIEISYDLNNPARKAKSKVK